MKYILPTLVSLKFHPLILSLTIDSATVFLHVVFFQMMKFRFFQHSNFSWRGRCRIIESDMRCLPAAARDLGLPQPDIVVSELLGSFGDNELSPECLDGVTSLLKPTTINIPQSYTSYAGRSLSHLLTVLFIFPDIDVKFVSILS